jgi:hypothetical protein
LAKLRITPEDMLKGKLIDPGVYLAQVKNVVEGESKTDKSQNWNVEFKIVQEGSAFNGVPIYKTFNEKGAGFVVPFIEACGGKINPKEDFELDFSKTIGTKLRIVVKNELYNGAMKNQIAGFMPAN